MKQILRILSIASLAALIIAVHASGGEGGNGDDGGGDGHQGEGGDGGDGNNGDDKNGEGGHRRFQYRSIDAISADYSAAGNVVLQARTRINVNPYLYITGNLGAEWTVNGWGTGADTKVETIKIYHNETVTLDLEQFAAPAKIAGTKKGSQSVDLLGQMRFVNDQTGEDLFDSGMVNIASLNGMFNPSGPNFKAGKTSGLLRVDFGRKISIKPAVGPGVYENVGLIKVIRN
jgi:hypothetical protein